MLPGELSEIYVPEGYDELPARGYTVELEDYVTVHDLRMDGMLIKSIFERGRGYDRPRKYDEIVIDYKINGPFGCVD